MPDDSIYAPFSIARRDDGTVVELGRGAMGITYAATDTQLGRRVALKVINATYLGDPTARQRFLSEARAAAQLHHSNVAGIYQLRAEGDDIFYAMEFVEGETLESYVKRCGPLSPRLALRVILQAAQGLAAANERGLIHRDIKPANLMLAHAPTPAGEGIEHEEEDGLLVKVIDFGLAKSVSGNDTGGGLTGGSVVGTPYYMSPEQISPEVGVPLDCRSDIYSLGVTLWYLLMGRAPFRRIAISDSQPAPAEASAAGESQRRRRAARGRDADRFDARQGSRRAAGELSRPHCRAEEDSAGRRLDHVCRGAATGGWGRHHG